MTAQPSLFDSPAPAPERRPPNLARIRKSLGRTLRLVRNAQVLPWSEVEAASREEQFPKLAAYLPPEEAEAMCAEFAAEMARLRKAA